MKLKSWTVALIVFVILFGGIGLSMAFNLWRTTSSKIPASFSAGEHAGEYNPGDIRGSYTLGDIEKAFQVPVDVLGKAFGVGYSENLEAFQVKGLEELYAGAAGDREIGTDSVRLFVALYKGLPYTPEETTALPHPAVSRLRELGTLSEEQVVFLDGIKVDVSQVKSTEAVESHDEPADRSIKGQTTFGELLQWGLTREQIEEVWGLNMGAPGVMMRDFAANNGMEFSAVKSQLQELADGLP